MADEFLVFSEVLCRLTEEEEKWLRHQLEWVVVIDGKEYQESEAPEDGNEEWSGCRGWMDFENGEPSGEIESCFEFHDNDKVGWGRYMWVHAEEFGDPEAVAHLIQKFLRAFRPNDYWTLSYALTCSRPWVGTFGGGVMIVTAEKFEHKRGVDVLEVAVAKFKRRHPSARCSGSGTD